MQLNAYQAPPQTPQAPDTGNQIVTNGDKGQLVRLGDVALFGPLMILGALNKDPPPWMRLALLVIGTGTIVYNARNYLRNL